MRDRPLTIIEILDKLKQCEKNVPVFIVGTLPVQLNGEIGSWRGDYQQVALGYVPYGTLDKKPITVGDLEELLKSEIGKTEIGWKGGKFVMSENTQVWLDNPGDSCNHAIVAAYPLILCGANFHLEVKYLDRF